MPWLLTLLSCSAAPLPADPVLDAPVAKPTAAAPAVAGPADLDGELAMVLPDDAARERVLGVFQAEVKRLVGVLGPLGPTTHLEDELSREVAGRLYRRRIEAPWVALDEATLTDQVIRFEAHKLDAWVRSGVFPKRYFGYFDELGDTAAAEARLRRTSVCLAEVANAWLTDQKESFRVTEAEIALTWLAEGGALLLATDPGPERLDSQHPVFDVGLDDIGSGFADLPGLQPAIDGACGTAVGGIVGWFGPEDKVLPTPSQLPENLRYVRHGNGEAGPFPYLIRNMTLEEALAGSAMMWVWEKRIAARKLASGGHEPFGTETAGSPPGARDFVIGSLVYNSGLLHKPATWTAITGFSHVGPLAATAAKHNATHVELPVVSSKEALARFDAGLGYPDQPTSWIGAYHVLQRYGAWKGVMRFSDAFDDKGRFTRRD